MKKKNEMSKLDAKALREKVVALKKELLNVAKSILSISINENNEDEDSDDEDLTCSEHLAKLIMKLSKIKGSNTQKTVKDKVGKTNPLEDKNAGFLVHYCKDILNKEIKQKKNDFKPEKLNKKDLNKFLKK